MSIFLESYMKCIIGVKYLHCAVVGLKIEWKPLARVDSGWQKPNNELYLYWLHWIKSENEVYLLLC